jgi:integrase
MPQKVRSPKLESRSARLRLAIRGKPYFVKVARGIGLGYRRTKTAGTWVVRVTQGGVEWTERLGTADDHEEPGPGILNYDEAQARARIVARGGEPNSDNSVKGALDRYEADLRTRGGDPNNVERIRCHLTEKLARKTVGSLTAGELRTWRDGLKSKGLTAASVGRTVGVFRAALNLAATTDERITNREAWRNGLAAIPGSSESRNVILEEKQVRVIVAAAYEHSREFGEFVEVIAITGARPSQVARLKGDDVQIGKPPRLMMPVSRKGRGIKKTTHRPVPITGALASRLKGRKETLLLQPGGVPWAGNSHSAGFAKIVRDAGLDPAVVTIYALRHTSVVRMLLANVPVRVVAALHDTSVVMIERTYSKYIADHADELARATLPETSAAVTPIRAKEFPA